MKGTAVFLVSNHGNNIVGIYNIFKFEDYVLEKTLVTWFMLLPQKEIDEKFLEINQQMLVSPYNIYDALLNIIVFDIIKIIKHFSEKDNLLIKRLMVLKEIMNIIPKISYPYRINALISKYNINIIMIYL